jgi:two-component system response regulator NreC
MSIRILLADDHKIVRDGLRALLHSQHDLELIAEAEDGRAAVNLATMHSPDVVVMDISMPHLNGVEATRQIKLVCPTAKVVILSAHADHKLAIEAINAGATALVPKGAAFEELVLAIRTVVEGKLYLSPSLRGDVVGALLSSSSQTDGKAFSALTPREREVLQLMAEGKATKEIANVLDLSTKTVETYRNQLKAKVGIDNVAELTKYAVRLGLTPP